MASIGEELWQAWKEFPSWFATFHSPTWDDAYDISNPDWTNGVMNPFIKTRVAPLLGCQARITHNYKDVELLKNGSPYIHIELENELKDVFSETKKLRDSQARLKCVTSYGTPEQVEEQAAMELEPMIDKAIALGSNSEWLLIYGVYAARKGKTPFMSSPTDWVAYSVKPNSQQPVQYLSNVQHKKLNWRP